ncbi:porin, partial [Pseudaminobacter sp. NGMCC 1.201702]|uniref:porin n=1 Tax=Pseudaminobacter sp. NGMCC 1.201702 TaxID=3391825 RepID=UPI0039F0A67C
NHGYIELGGFRLGRTDSLFTTMTNYAGDILADDIVPYGPFDTNQIAYTFTGGNGFSAAVALEEGAGSVDLDGDGDADYDLYTIDSYVPHVVAGVAFTQGWGGISAVVGYDSNWEEWAGKVRLDVNATEAISLWAMAGYKSGADDGDVFGPGTDNPNFYGQWGGDWAVWGGAAFQINEKAKFNAQLSYDEAENFAAVANVVYEVVPGFAVTPEVNYQDNFDEDDADGVGGWLRFRRSF